VTIHPGDLAGRGPLGQKQPKPPKKARAPIPKFSKKRRAYLASDLRKQGKAHMAAVAALPCLVCSYWPVEVHHDYPHGARDDLKVLPLCARHHRREYGPGSYHYSPRAFYEAHGSHEDLLERVRLMLNAAEDSCLAAWF